MAFSRFRFRLTMSTRGAAYEIRFCKDNIVQVFDLSKKNEFNEQKLPYEYDEDDVINGRLRYSKLLAEASPTMTALPSSSPPLQLTEQGSHPIPKPTRSNQEILLQVESRDKDISQPTWSSASFSSTSSTCYTKSTPSNVCVNTALRDNLIATIPPPSRMHQNQRDGTKSASRSNTMEKYHESGSTYATTCSNIPDMSQLPSPINPPQPALRPMTYREHWSMSDHLPPHVETDADAKRQYEMEERREAATAAGCCCIIC
ncbi:hypothetical protein BX666DRAFT_1958420 [Dichotomocladium elegans]|nr:hypothetical protein BX666DRAFT_1958420 [Dichotomocladium elegans]